MGLVRPLPLALAAVLAGCTPGAIGDGDDTCGPAADTAPATPSVVDPAPGRLDVLPEQLVLGSSAFADPDAGDVHDATEWELWTVVRDELTARVWRAEVADAPRLLQVTLDDGAFEGIADGVGLSPWIDYAARVRHRGAGADCATWSEWSAPLRFRTDDGSTLLFDETQVRSVYLTIPPESWQPIDDEALPPGCVNFRRSYHRGALVLEGVTYEGVGIRVKGGCGSSRNLSGKPSFKVNLEWDDPDVPGCAPDREPFGQKALTFNNEVQDRTFQNERLTYTLYQALGVPAPRSAHVRLYVNGELWGLYNHVETTGRRFISRWFENNRGMMYEGAYWCDLLGGNVEDSLGDTGCFSREFEASPVCNPADPGDDPTDWALLGDLVARIEAMPEGGFYPEVEAYFDFDRFLSMWAVEAIVAHWDAYSFHILNNYRVYHDPDSGRWTMIPWGTDQTFAGDLDPWDSEAVLVTRCLREPDCQAAFAARLAEAVTVFEQLDLGSRAQATHDRIAPHVMEDPRKEIDYGSWDSNSAVLLGWIAARPAQMRERIANHGF